MDEKQNKRASIIIVVLIVILIGFVAFVSFTYGNVFLTGKHIYESPSGNEFTFIENKVGELTLYDLQVYTEQSGVEHLYQIPLRNLPNDVKIVSFEEGIQK